MKMFDLLLHSFLKIVSSIFFFLFSTFRLKVVASSFGRQEWIDAASNQSSALTPRDNSWPSDTGIGPMKFDVISIILSRQRER